ncbi:MAG: c-type cytochrome [Nitrospinae bacterium]|nr:c-type cytochrome [Nitrospinota bacterium]
MSMVIKRAFWIFGTVSIVFLMVITATSHSVSAQEKSQDGWRVSPRKAKIINPIPADDASLALGKKIYQRECLECHGKTGKGDGPEASELEKTVGDFTDPKMREQSDGAIFWKISTGRRPMPGFKKLLTDEERWHVINYIRLAFNSPKK